MVAVTAPLADCGGIENVGDNDYVTASATSR